VESEARAEVLGSFAFPYDLAGLGPVDHDIILVEVVERLHVAGTCVDQLHKSPDFGQP
jgi:hypothetical protein